MSKTAILSLLLRAHQLVFLLLLPFPKGLEQYLLELVKLEPELESLLELVELELVELELDLVELQPVGLEVMVFRPLLPFLEPAQHHQLLIRLRLST